MGFMTAWAGGVIDTVDVPQRGTIAIPDTDGHTVGWMLSGGVVVGGRHDDAQTFHHRWNVPAAVVHLGPTTNVDTAARWADTVGATTLATLAHAPAGPARSLPADRVLGDLGALTETPRDTPVVGCVLKTDDTPVGWLCDGLWNEGPDWMLRVAGGIIEFEDGNGTTTVDTYTLGEPTRPPALARTLAALVPGAARWRREPVDATTFTIGVLGKLQAPATASLDGTIWFHVR